MIAFRAMKDLKHEAYIHRQLRHPCIVSMLGIVLEEGNYGLVLEYVLYGAMDQFLKDVNDMQGHNHTLAHLYILVFAVLLFFRKYLIQ